ncbi:MAG: AI-2E family transporter [Pirellulaceae bacterium]|nr:AI-2E family transporter [Pirellulaceae bacterium]
MSRLMSLIALIAVIVVIGLLFYKVMVGFFVPVFLAAVLVVVFRPLHLYILKKTGNRPKVAAAATTCLIMLSVLVPFALIGSAAALQGVGLVQDLNEGSVRVALVKLQNHLGLELDYKPQLDRIQTDLEHLLTAAEQNSNFNNFRSSAASEVQSETPVVPPDMVRLGHKLADAMEALRVAIANNQEAGPKPVWDETLTALVKDAHNFGNNSEDEDSSYLDSAKRLSYRYREIRKDILGGIYLAFFKDLANPTKEQLAAVVPQIKDYIQPRLLSLTSATVGFTLRLVIGTAILIVCVFFFLYDGPGMVTTIMALIPLDDRYEAELLMEFDRISRAVVLATIFSAITQGAVAGMGYYVAGLPSLVLLIMLTTMFAMVPFVGPAIVWVPACLYLAFYENRLIAAGGLALWGVLIVGTVDNFVKAGVLHGQSQLHPLLALLSVLGGVQALGPIGIVVGPMAVVLLQTSLSILQREMVHFEDHGFLSGFRKDGTSKRFRLRRRRRREAPAAESSTSATLANPATPTTGVVAPGISGAEATKSGLEGAGPTVEA